MVSANGQYIRALVCVCVCACVLVCVCVSELLHGMCVDRFACFTCRFDTEHHMQKTSIGNDKL